MAKKILHATISLEGNVADTVSELLAENGKTIGVHCAELLALDMRARKDGFEGGLASLVEQYYLHDGSDM